MSAARPSKRLILPLPGNEAFARQLAEAGRWALGAIETRRFPDGESYVRIAAEVADKSVVLVQTLAQPDPDFLSLIFAADAARDDGWFDTGDIATLDENGYTIIRDRSKDIIKSGGEWIGSVELENAIMAHPAVAQCGGAK